MSSISIVTICFNNLSELQRTMSSIDAQSYLPFEHWVIDGSSNREIKQFLESSPNPSYRKWISEPDRGISDAFNKGLKKCNGDIIQILNSGDVLFDEQVLAKVNNLFETNAEIQWCHGKLETVRGKLIVLVGKPFDKAKLYRGMRGVFHPTMFVKRSLYQQVGGYDEAIKIAMDYDFLCRIKQYPVEFISYPLVKFDDTGVSTKNYLRGVKESHARYRHYFGFHPLQKLWYVRLWLIHKLMQTFLGTLLYRLKVAVKLESW